MSDVADLKAEVLALRAENAELRKHVKMPDEPLEIDEEDFYVRAFIKWATEEQPAVKKLEAENEKLRKERDFYFQQVTENSERAHGAIDALNAENAKLRELVRDMYACIESLCSMVENSPGCSICPTNQDEEKPCAAADVYCRMRELGVDFDG